MDVRLQYPATDLLCTFRALGLVSFSRTFQMCG